MSVQYDFSNRVVFITGGSSGIGLATANAFARAGARIAIAARGEARGREACAMLERVGAESFFVGTDVSDEESVAHAVRATVARFGRLDFGVNSAGHGGDMAPLERTDQAVWDRAMAVNARGTWLAMRHEVLAMLETGGGAVVNISAIYGLAGKAAHHAYVASKHAILGMTRSVALELATRGVRVNAVCAGVTRTPSMVAAESAFPEVVAQLVAEHPMGRMATEQEIASTVQFLCSDAASFITGTPVAVDGGFLAA